MKPLSIVDSHVHFWNPARFRYAWLDELPILNRTFLPADFTVASEGSNVDKMIFVESGCDPAQNLSEVNWISALAQTLHTTSFEPGILLLLTRQCIAYTRLTRQATCEADPWSLRSDYGIRCASQTRKNTRLT